MPGLITEDTAAVYQATDETLSKSNIYCEIPYCSSDSRVFVYQRRHPDRAPNTTEYVACEFGTWKTHVIGSGLGAPAMSHAGIFYYRHVRDDEAQDLVRVDLATGEARTIYTFPENFQPKGLGTISPDERYYAYGVTISFDPQMFGIELVDIENDTRDIIHTDPYICNPHTQFEPSEGKQVMVQHNRGCRYTPDGTRELLVGPEGASEFLLDIPDGTVTRLAVGPPDTPSSTGHEAWIGDTKEILFSVSATVDEARETGNLYAVRAGSPARIVSKGYRFSHVNTSVCGRFFCCDDTQTSDVIVGSTRTGKNARVCCSEASFGSSQDTHPHPYLSPDLEWVVFNNDSSGQTQICAAQLPEGLLNDLEA